MCSEIIYQIYMFKKDLALNNLQWLICYKTKPMCVCLCVYVFVNLHVYICLCVYLHVYVYIYIYV